MAPSATATITASTRSSRGSLSGSSGTSACRARMSSATASRGRSARRATPKCCRPSGRRSAPKEAREASSRRSGAARRTARRSRRRLRNRVGLLARGDRRDFVVIDPKGGTHSLARRIEGAKIKDVRERLAHVDMKTLPSVAEGRAAQYARYGKPEPVRAPRRSARKARRARGHDQAACSRSASSAAWRDRRRARPAESPRPRARRLRAWRARLKACSAARLPSRGTTTRGRSIAGAAPPKAEIDEALLREQEQQSERRAKYVQRILARSAGRTATRRRDRARQEGPRANAGGIGRPARGRRRRGEGSPRAAAPRGGQRRAATVIQGGGA